MPADRDVTDEEIEALRMLCEAATPGPWRAEVHASGTVNVVMRVGDCWNEYGPGALYASILLYNQGAYSDGATDDGVQVERQAVARLIAAARNALPALLRAAAERNKLRCPWCSGNGWTIEPDQATGEASQVQCGACSGTGLAIEYLRKIEAERNALRAENERLAARVRELEALLSDAERVAGNAAAHWHPVAGPNLVTVSGVECPGCFAEEDSRRALSAIRAAMARKEQP